MAKFKKKGDPELLLISFCDIVTVTCVALFMAMIIVVWEAIKTPEIRATPMIIATTNTPVFFECRNRQIYPVDIDAIVEQLQAAAQSIPRGTNRTPERALEHMMGLDIGDEYYKVSNNHLMLGMVALNPRQEIKGVDEESALAEGGIVRETLARFSPSSHYIVFYVRDDSFSIFRKARQFSTTSGWASGWEYLDRKEPLSFVGIMGRVGLQ